MAGEAELPQTAIELNKRGHRVKTVLCKPKDCKRIAMRVSTTHQSLTAVISPQKPP